MKAFVLIFLVKGSVGIFFTKYTKCLGSRPNMLKVFLKLYNLQKLIGIPVHTCKCLFLYFFCSQYFHEVGEHWVYERPLLKRLGKTSSTAVHN